MKSLNQLLTALGLAGLFAFAGTAVAGDDFSEYDADGDGMISAQEAQNHDGLMAQWPELDGNRDGVLDQGEFARFEADEGRSDQPRDDDSGRDQQPGY